MKIPSGFSTDCTMKQSTIVILAFLLCPGLIAQTTGSLCVLPNSAQPPDRISPGGYYNPKTLKMKIDKQQSVSWPHKENLPVEGLDINIRHLLALYSDGKPIQSLWFRFSDFQTSKLQVSFDGYQGVQIHSLRPTQSCITKKQ